MFVCLSSPAALAQKKAQAKKATVVEVAAQIVDENGSPIEDAVVIAGEGALTSYTGPDGRFSIKSKDDAIILIEAVGYKDVVVNLASGACPSTIKLTAEPFLMGEADKLDRMDGQFTYRHDLAAAISSVDVDKLNMYPSMSLTNTLQGRVAGLRASLTNGGIGNDFSNFSIRGQHGGTNSPIVVIDGIERDMDDLAAEEIGSIEVLKDAPAKVLYGPRAANGVILITTRRGEENKRIIKTSVECGVNTATRVPEYLDAYQYANLYNEARQNDGLADYYLPYQIEGYKNSAGENDLLYPNHDWYGQYTRNVSMYRKASAEFIGGSDRVKYAVIASYTGGSGYERIPKAAQLNRINVRGNLDIKINSFLTATADVAARLESRKWVGKDGAGLYGAISTLRPNEYPTIINPEEVGLAPNEDGTPYYGASIANTSNLYVDMTYGGDKETRYVNSQTNLGLKFDFDQYVKGLFANAYITFDNRNAVNTGMNRTYATYAVDGFLDEYGNQQLRVAQVTKLNQNDNINITNENTTRTIGFLADGGYSYTIGEHNLSAVAAFRYYIDEVTGANQNCVTSSGTLRLNYDWRKRLFLEGVVGINGSNQFAKNNRYRLVGSGSIAYIVSEDPYVKVKASAGRLAYDPNGSYLLYRTGWAMSGNYKHGETNNTQTQITVLNRVGNAGLGWIMQYEANIGAEARLFNNRLAVEANGFFERRNHLITKLGSMTSNVIGDFLPSVNYGKVINGGVELDLRWSDKAFGGDFRYSVGANITFTQNRNMMTNELYAESEAAKRNVGKPTSTIFGLHSIGLFGKDVDRATAPRQMFGEYTDGDLAYADTNKDGVIDDKDEIAMGQTYPLVFGGIDVDLKYKGFGLYILGTYEFGAVTELNNTYYQNIATNGYSVKALERYHAVNNPNGTLPRLTTTTGSNSYRSSDFWVANDNWFRLKNVEFSYTLQNKTGKGFCKTAKFFVRGTNLCVISAIKDLDPEVINAGVTNYPLSRAVTAGATISF